MRKFFKGTIRRTYTDFYTTEDIQEPESPVPNLSIDNFDSKGLIVNPEAPCLATTIDPNYVRDCNKPLKIRKFLVKSDILRLRNITRTKFFFYSTRERALEKQREQEQNTKIYQEIMQFYKFCFKELSEVESATFRQMREKFDELQKLRKQRPSDERSQLELEHQRVYTKVMEVYQKFRYLLKLIDYFDNVSDESEDIEKLSKILNKQMNQFLTTVPANHSIEETEKLKGFMENLIKPYLAKKHYLNAEVWRKGYESIRRRIFNYSRHLTSVALMNHIVNVIYEKFTKSYDIRLQPKIFLKKPGTLRTRTSHLKKRTYEYLQNWETQFRSGPVNVSIAAVIPTTASNLGVRTEPSGIPPADYRNVMEKLEKIQYVLTSLLNQLDSAPPELVKQTEKDVRRNTERQKRLAKQALVKQTRLQNLLDHYRNHYKKKNIVRQYTTLISRHRGRVHATGKC